MIDDSAQIVTAGDLVLNLPEDFADLVFDGVRPGGLLFEAMQVREEFSIDEVDQIVAGLGFVVVDLAVFALWGGPFLPAVGFVENERVLLAFERSLVGLILLQS